MGRLTFLLNDKELLLTNLSSKVRKNVRPKKRFQIVTHPHLVRLTKNVLEVFHVDIANLARYRMWFFSIWDPKIDWFLVGPFWLTFVKNNWWACNRLAKWWIIAVDRFEAQKQFSQIWFLYRKKKMCVKKVTNIQIVTHSYLFQLSKNMLEVFHHDIANLAWYRKCFFFFSILDPKIDWFLVGPFGLTFVKNNWLGVWPSCQMMKKCCWPIWAPKSGKKFRNKKQFSQI